MCFDRGTFWVFPLAYFYLRRSARAYLFPEPSKLITSAAAPLVLTPFVRNHNLSKIHSHFAADPFCCGQVCPPTRRSRMPSSALRNMLTNRVFYLLTDMLLIKPDAAARSAPQREEAECPHQRHGSERRLGAGAREFCKTASDWALDSSSSSPQIPAAIFYKDEITRTNKQRQNYKPFVVFVSAIPAGFFFKDITGWPFLCFFFFLSLFLCVF